MVLVGLWRLDAGYPISDEQKRKIYEAHKMGIGSYRAAKYTGVSHYTVLKYWHLAELEVREKFPSHSAQNPGSKLKPEQIAEINAANSIYKGNVSKAAKNLPYSPISIRNYWDEAGLPRMRRGKRN